MSSDEQFIQHIRRWQAWRRPVGAATLGLALYRVFYLHAEALAVFGRDSDARKPTTREVEETWQALKFATGMSLGFALGITVSLGLWLIVSGLATLMGSRKDRLLLQAWKGRDTGPRAGQDHGRA